MVCDIMALNRAEQEARKKALEELERQLLSGEKMLVQDPLTGEMKVEGWETSEACASGWAEGCAMAYLAEHGSWELQTSIMGGEVKEQLKAQHGGHGGHGSGGDMGGGW